MGVNGDSPYQRFPAAGFTLTFDRYDTMVAGAANPAGDPDFSGREIALWEDECNCDVTSYTQPGSGHAMFFPETMRISSTPPPAGSKAAVSATGDVARTSPRGLFVSDLW